ncbi:ferredoxin [Candidatus Woesearchaeota archaeon]|nr:ferredoxin [Candidatus Woesearchaeota archaeon]
MVKYFIRLKRTGCIGAVSCEAMAPKHWKLANDGKIDLISSKLIDKENDIWELEIEAKDLEKNVDAAKACPVNVIEIYDEQGNKIA